MWTHNLPEVACIVERVGLAHRYINSDDDAPSKNDDRAGPGM